MLWLLHVVPPDVFPSAQTGTSLLQKKAFHETGAVLARVSFEMSTENVPCSYDVRCGSPVDRIIEFIHEREISRLILGTSSKGKASKLLTGSVAEALIHTLDIPVCTVGPHCGPVPQSNPRRVLFATSLRTGLQKAFNSHLTWPPYYRRSSQYSTSWRRAGRMMEPIYVSCPRLMDC
jgi:hypothetical protein